MLSLQDGDSTIADRMTSLCTRFNTSGSLQLVSSVKLSTERKSCFQLYWSCHLEYPPVMYQDIKYLYTVETHQQLDCDVSGDI